MSTSCRIAVLGRTVPVRTTASPELVQEIETMVNDRLTAAAASLSLPDPQMTAIMALLNMAEEIALLRKSVDRESDWSQRLASLVAQLDCVAAGSR